MALALWGCAGSHGGEGERGDTGDIQSSAIDSAIDSVIDTGPPTLTSLGVKLEDLNPEATGGPLLLFGEPDPEGSGVRPNMAFRTALDAEVYAPVAGRVERLLFQGGYGDWELHIRPEGSPAWLVILDHVITPTVAADDDVTAGQVLGAPKPWGPGFAQVELHVMREPYGSNATIAHVCPVPLLAVGRARDQIAERLATFGLLSSGCVCSVIDEEPGQTTALTCQSSD